MQHLKRFDRGSGATFVPAAKTPLPRVLPELSLPRELFASATEEPVGMLHRAAPNSNPALDCDPDVLALLEDDEDDVDDADHDPGGTDAVARDHVHHAAAPTAKRADPEDELEDDFVIRAMSAPAKEEADAGAATAGRGHAADSAMLAMWLGQHSSSGNRDRGAAASAQRPTVRAAGNDAAHTDDTSSGSGSSDDDGSDGGSDDDRSNGSGSSADASPRGRSSDETRSRFTEYSMTSSIMRRSEGLRLLDERFEKVRIARLRGTRAARVGAGMTRGARGS